MVMMMVMLLLLLLVCGKERPVVVLARIVGKVKRQQLVVGIGERYESVGRLGLQALIDLGHVVGRARVE